MTEIQKPGMYDLPMQAYLDDPCPVPSISSGLVKTLNERTAYHAKIEHPRLGNRPSRESTDMDFGSAVHQMVFGGPSIETIPYENFRTKDARAMRDAARAVGKIPILSKHKQQLIEMSGRVEDAIAALGLKREPLHEKTIAWEENGTWYKTRPDLISDYIVDLKTSRTSSPGEFIRKVIFQMGYDVQSAMQQRGWAAVNDGELLDVVWMVQEKEPPYLVSLVGASPGVLEIGNRKIDYATRVWNKCVESSNWPGFTGDIHWADVPSWAEWGIEETEAMESLV